MPLSPLLLIILALSGLFMVALAAAAHWAATVPYRTRDKWSGKPGGFRLYRSVVFNAVLSAAFVLVVAHGLYAHLMHDGATPIWRIALEAVGILAVYDFLYYFMHRFLFHEWKLLRRVHTVHHAAKHPNALHSLWMHPVENLAGLVLLMVSTLVIGPVHVYAFAFAFIVYSFLNIAIHSGLDLPGMRAFGYLARKHDKHHQNMQAGNFASITPLPDILFGTAE